MFTIRLGDHNLVRSDDNVSPVDIPVVKVERHADFVPRTFKNDVAVLTMERPATFNKFVRPVCLPYGSDFASRDLNGYHAFVTGWGTTAFSECFVQVSENYKPTSRTTCIVKVLY